MTRLVGIVLAAGQGTRFDPSGRRWKLLEPLDDGRSIVRTSCERLRPHVDELIVVCSPAQQALLDQALDGLALRLVPCPDASAGMGASLKCGVQASDPSVGWVLALADMPFVAASTLQQICARLVDGAAIVRPSFEGRPGHPVGFSATLRPTLMVLDDRFGASQILRDPDTECLIVPVDDAGSVRDIDRPEDLKPSRKRGS